MTLKGKVNHYNVKVLRGYGVSIKLKDNRIVLQDGYDFFTKAQEKEEWFVTKIPYEKIVISGKGYISTEGIKLLTEKNINVILTDTYGNVLSYMNQVMSSTTATQYRIGQYDTFRNSAKVQYLQKWVLESKLKSQANWMLQMLPKSKLVDETVAKLKTYSKKVPNATDKQGLSVIESRAGHVYFNFYTSLFSEKFNFDSRHGGGIHLSNRYASDVINGLLNYGYAVLAGEIIKFVNATGLDAYYGFYHASHTSFPALVYDLIEPFRWLVDRAVYQLAVNEARHGRQIRRKDYTWTREGRIILSSELIRRY
jgi:CRISP-associated protein Cas1